MKMLIISCCLLPLFLFGQNNTASFFKSLHNPGDQLDSLQGWSWVDHPEIGILETRSFFEYDDEGRLLEQIIMTWDGIQWNNSSKFSYEYVTGGKVTVYTSQTWNNGQWENQEQLVYTLDDHDDLISILKQVFDGTNWVFSTLDTYNYNDLHQLLGWVTGQWTGNAWQNEIQRVYLYDQDQRLVLLVIKTWDGIQWNDQNQITYTYDANENLIQELGQKFVFGGWHNDYKHDFEYDEHHHVTSLVQYHAGADFFVKSHRILYTYDAFQNLIIERNQFNLKDFWFDGSRNLYQYDDRQNKISDVFQDWSAGWKSLDSTQYFYTLFTSDETLRVIPEFYVSPNPVTNFLNIRMTSEAESSLNVIIYSMSGKLIKHLQIVTDRNEQIDVTDLPPGSYILTIYAKAGTVSRSFLKV